MLDIYNPLQPPFFVIKSCEKGGGIMRTLKYAILGLLNRCCMTGYDIAREFEQDLGGFWSAGHSQIYPELKKLTDEGLIEFDTVIQGERMEKKLYSLTDAGVAAFLAWVRLDEPPEPTPKDTFRLRVYLSDALDDSELFTHFQSQLVRRERKLDELERCMVEKLNAYKDECEDKTRRGDCFVLQGAVMRERAYIEWLQWCINHLRDTTCAGD